MKRTLLMHLLGAVILGMAMTSCEQRSKGEAKENLDTVTAAPAQPMSLTGSFDTGEAKATHLQSVATGNGSVAVDARKARLALADTSIKKVIIEVPASFGR